MPKRKHDHTRYFYKALNDLHNEQQKKGKTPTGKSKSKRNNGKPRQGEPKRGTKSKRLAKNTKPISRQTNDASRKRKKVVTGKIVPKRIASAQFTTTKKRGDNQVNFNFSARSIKGKFEAVQNFRFNKTFQTLLNKNRVKGKGVKAPRGIIVIVTFTRGKDEFVQSRKSDFDFVVNEESIINFIQDFIEELLNADLGERYDEILKKARIKQISIRFIY
jgi:hypothetical protein